MQDSPQQPTGYQPSPGYPPYQQPSYPPQYPPESPYPMPPQAPAPKPRQRIPWLWIIGSLLVGLIIGYAIHVPPSTPSTSSATTQQTTTASQPTQASTTAPATPTPAHQAKWTTVESFSGSGSKKTAIFPVPSDWLIVWKCTGDTTYNVDGTLGITVNDSQNNYVDSLSETCKVAGSSGSSEEHQAGSIYLSVDFVGTSWSVSIQVMK